MKLYTFSFVSLFLLAVAVLLGVAAHAQQPASPSGSLLPRVYADGLTATVSGQTLQGSFTVNDADQAPVGGVGYSVMILGELGTQTTNSLQADNAPTYFRVRSSDSLSLAAGEHKDVSFSYQIPSIPTGTYRVRVQLVTANDRELGWDTADVAIQGSSTAFAVVQPVTVDVESHDPLNPSDVRTTWSPIEGVNVDPGMDVTLQASATQSGTTPLSLVPTLTVERLLSDDPSTKQTLDAVTVAAKGSTKLPLQIKAPTTPGTYAMYLTLNDTNGTAASTEAEFRMVVRGASASVVSASFEKPAFKAGDTATVAFAVVGAADRETAIDGTVEVSVLDGDRVIGSASASRALTLAASQGTADVQLTDAAAQTLGLRVVLKDSAGAVLDTYTVAFPDISIPAEDTNHQPVAVPSGSSGRTLMWAGIGVALAVLIGLLAWMKMRGKSMGSSSLPPMAVLVIGLSVVTALLLSAWQGHFAQASGGIQFKDCSTSATAEECGLYDLWINSPHPDEGITPGAFEYEARMTWNACLNGVSGASLSVYALTPGGEITNRTVTNLAQTTKGVSRDVAFSGSGVTPFSASIPADQLLAAPTGTLPNWEFLARSRSNLRSAQGSGTGFVQDSHTFHGILQTGTQAGQTTIWTEAVEVRDADATSGQVRNAVVIDDFTPVTVPQNKVVIDPNLTKQAQGFCPADSPTVAVLSQKEVGAKYTHTGAAGRYRIEIVSPEGLSDDAYRAYTWANWPDDNRARIHGGAVFVIKNDSPKYAAGNGGNRVSNSDLGFSGFLFDPPYNNSRTQAANQARNDFKNIDLKPGDFLTFSMNAIKDIPDTAQGSYIQNSGAVQMRICPDPQPQCSDGKDNDGDGKIDYSPGANGDPGCTSGDDNDEKDPVCADTLDNDGDGKIDCSDPGCWTDANDASTCDPNGTSEDDTQCSDGIDNDGDQLVDCSDPGCWTEKDNPNSCDANLNDESHIPGFTLPGFNEVE